MVGPMAQATIIKVCKVHEHGIGSPCLLDSQVVTSNLAPKMSKGP